jgi:hypothetical protein
VDVLLACVHVQWTSAEFMAAATLSKKAAQKQSIQQHRLTFCG